METMTDNGYVIALRARAEAREAEADAALVSVRRLAGELRIARAESRIARARLEAIARMALGHVAPCRDDRARMALGTIAAWAAGAERCISYLVPR
jgi:hypothetical protein